MGAYMERREYSAGMVKMSFWFSEFRKVIQLLNEGRTWEEIKYQSLEDNLFGAPTNARAKQILTTVTDRVKSLDEGFYRLFESSDISTQKIISLIAIMETDTLFFDFVYEVYREKLILGSNTLADSDLGIYFKNKQVQSDKVAGWTDNTLKRLGACYKTLLMEAGMIDRSLGERTMLKPILDIGLERKLKDTGMELVLKSLTGVR
jgi:hypothetical protein